MDYGAKIAEIKAKAKATQDPQLRRWYFQQYQQIKAQQAQEEQMRANTPSPGAQVAQGLLGVAGTAGGMYLGSKIPSLFSSTAAEAGKEAATTSLANLGSSASGSTSTASTFNGLGSLSPEATIGNSSFSTPSATSAASSSQGGFAPLAETSTSSTATASSTNAPGTVMGFSPNAGIMTAVALAANDQYQRWSDKLSGNKRPDRSPKGLVMEEARNLMAGGMPGAGLVRAAMRIGKSDQLLQRDIVRDVQKQTGVVNDNYEIELGNSRYRLNDGGARLADGRRLFEIDHKDPRANQAIANVDWLADLVTRGRSQGKQDAWNGTSEDEKISTAGYYTNAVLGSGMDLNEASRELAKKHGINNKKQAYDAINRMEATKGIDTSLANIYRNTVNNLYR